MAVAPADPYTEPPLAGSAGSSPRWHDRVALVLVVLLTIAHAGARTLTRFPRFEEFLYVQGDQGNQIFRAEQILQGHLIYRDFDCQYGPLPSYLYAGLLWLCGGSFSPVFNLSYHMFFRSIAMVMIYLALRRAFPPVRAALLAIVAGIPTLVTGLGVDVHAEYIPIEIILFLSVFLIYRVPVERTWRRGLSIGLLLGACQWTKFGGGVFLGLSVVLLDLLWLVRTRASFPVWKHWILNSLMILLGSVLLEVAFIAFCFLACPPALALDFIFPSYMLGVYKDNLRGLPRFPRILGLKNFAAHLWLFLSCALLALGAFAHDLNRRFRDSDSTLATGWIAFVFAFLAAIFYCRHEPLYYQYAWTIVLPGILALGRLPRIVFSLVLLSWLLTFAAGSRAVFHAREPVPMTLCPMPRGGSLWLTAREKARMDQISRIISQTPDSARRNGVLCFSGWGGEGFYHYFEAGPPPLRNLLVIRHNYRSYDVRELASRFDGIHLVFILSPPDEDLFLGAFPKPLRQRFLYEFTRHEWASPTNGASVVYWARNSPDPDTGPRNRP